MSFLDNEFNQKQKHIINLITKDDFNIIICNQNLGVISFSENICKILNIEKNTNLNEILSPYCCKGLKNIFINQTESRFLENIDNEDYIIKVSYFENQLVLVFEKDKDDLEIKTVALLTSYKLNQYQTQNALFMEKVSNFVEKNDDSYEIYLKDRYNFNKLSYFVNQLSQLYTAKNNNRYSFICGDLTDILNNLINQVKKNILNSDINFQCNSKIICDFAPYEIELAVVNVISHIYKRNSYDTKIVVDLTESDDDVFIKIKTLEACFDLEKIKNTYDLPYVSSYKELQDVEIELIIARRIISKHFGSVKCLIENENTEIILSFPKTFSGLDELSNHNFYRSSELMNNIIKVIADFDNFKSVF